MSKKPTETHRPPAVDTKKLQERKLLEAQLFTIDAQTRNFSQIRDALSAAGQDSEAFYRKTQARRAKTVEALKRVRSTIPSPIVKAPRRTFENLDGSLLAFPIASAKFFPVQGIWGIGTTGFVQLAPPIASNSFVITGQYPSSGTIDNVSGAYPGTVFYEGLLNVGPDEFPTGSFDPSIDYFWIRNWTYLVPFPPPTVESIFTYSFNASALASVFWEGSAGQIMSFVSIGETNNLVTGVNVVANTDAGWPLMADLTQPGEEYNGRYGDIPGSDITVERSFVVGGGHVPGVAIVVGVIASMCMASRLTLTFDQYSIIGLSSESMPGRVSYSYEPQLLLEP